MSVLSLLIVLVMCIMYEERKEIFEILFNRADKGKITY